MTVGIIVAQPESNLNEKNSLGATNHQTVLMGTLPRTLPRQRKFGEGSGLLLLLETNLLCLNPRPNISVVDSVYGDGMPSSVSTTECFDVVTVRGGLHEKWCNHHCQYPRTIIRHM